MNNENGKKCYKCETNIKIGYEWVSVYHYCPNCREDRSELGEEIKKEETNTEKRYKSMYNLERKKSELFERKFIDYRNKMVEVLLGLEEHGQMQDIQKSIRKFLEEEQKDVRFE